MVNFFFLLNILKLDNLDKYLKNDFSLRLLVFSNILLIVFAIIGNWTIAPVLFVYWFQSVVIGVFIFLRLLTTDFGANIKFVSKYGAKNLQIVLAFFFMIHYGLFHLGYLVFILIFAFIFQPGYTGEIFFLLDPLFLISLIVIFINHAFSEKYNSGDYLGKSAPEIMFSPYGRIIPMHLTLIFGTFLMFLFQNQIIMLVLFLILKTIFDIKGHIAKHKNKF